MVHMGPAERVVAAVTTPSFDAEGGSGHDVDDFGCGEGVCSETTTINKNDRECMPKNCKSRVSSFRNRFQINSWKVSTDHVYCGGQVRRWREI